MEQVKIIAIGDNVFDKYLSRGKMYPGGQCVNTCAYAKMQGAHCAYLGKYGNDESAKQMQSALKNLQIDDSRCRVFSGENPFAMVTLKGSDRVFLGSNRGGVAKSNPYNFTKEDLDYIREFDLIYSDLNAYIEDDLAYISQVNIPIAYDFSLRWTDDYLAKVCPFVTIALLSCAHLSDEKREEEMKKVQAYGVKIVLGTVGEKGSYLLYKNKFYYAEAVLANDIIDTMGAGDSYFATFLTSLLKSRTGASLLDDDESLMVQRLTGAMKEGAIFAAKVCALEGAFGHGVPIIGRTHLLPGDNIGPNYIRPDCYENDEEGIKFVYRNPKWLVCIKNWKPDNDINGIAHLEIHHSTDEQFVLAAGKAILITAERVNNKFTTINLTPMKQGRVYNVPAEMWFYSITQKDTKMVYVQDSNCSMQNSELADLTAEEIADIQARARALFEIA